MDGKMMLGVNVGVLVILTLFTTLLVLPLRLLLPAKHQVQQNVTNETSTIVMTPIVQVMEYRRLQLCPAGYRHWITSTFISNYDGNCTYESTMKDDYAISDNVRGSGNNLPAGFRVIRPKSVPVTDHILALMLIVSVIGAFVELLKLRFINPEVCSTQKHSTLNPRFGID